MRRDARVLVRFDEWLRRLVPLCLLVVPRVMTDRRLTRRGVIGFGLRSVELPVRILSYCKIVSTGGLNSMEYKDGLCAAFGGMPFSVKAIEYIVVNIFSAIGIFFRLTSFVDD